MYAVNGARATTGRHVESNLDATFATKEAAVGGTTWTVGSRLVEGGWLRQRSNWLAGANKQPVTTGAFCRGRWVERRGVAFGDADD